MDSPRHRIVVGVSGSVGSLHALRAAVMQARRAPGDGLHAVLAWAPPGGEIPNRNGVPGRLLEVWVEAARRRLAEAFDDAMGGVPVDIAVTQHIVRGRPGHVLVEVAREADLLVVGAGDHGAFHRLAVGSVSRHCLAHASCPVLVVPPPPLLRTAQARRLARVTHWHRVGPYPW